MDDELCRRRVQVDRGGTRDHVKEGGGPRVEGYGLDCLHGNKGDVVEGVTLYTLNINGAESGVNLVPEGDGG